MKRFAVGMLTLLGAASSAWADVTRHSGQVVSFDPAAGTLRIAELTASPGPEPIVVERVVQVAPSTQLHVVRRTATLEHWPVTWDAEPLPASAVGAGDFVTVTADGEAAVKLEVVRPGAERRG
jgi:hypothetical protein